MSLPADREVVLGFVAEATSYLPEIREGLRALAEGRPEPMAEAHRHTHTIRGASSMVGLAGLSQIGAVLEQAVEELVNGRLEKRPETFAILGQVVDLIEAYLIGYRDETLHEAPLLEEAGRLAGALQEAPPPETPAPSETPPEFDAGAPDWLTPPTWDETPPLDVSLPELPPEPQVVAPPPEPEPEPEPEPAPAASTADEVDPELLEVFALEAEDHLRTISLGLPEYEANPTNKEVLQQVRRSTHTLKGAAGMVGFRNITQLAHRMEDVLDLLYEDTLQPSAEIVKLLFGASDALEDMAKGKSDAALVATLLDGFGAVLAGVAPEKAPVATAEVAEVAPAVEEPTVAAEEPATAGRATTQYIRVPIERLDEMVKLVSELVIARGAIEQRLNDFLKQVAELRPSTERLRRVSYKLETQYEASALASGRLFGGAGGGSSGPGGGHGWDDLEFDRYTEFHLLSRDLAETTNDIQTVAGELGHLLGDFDSYLNRQQGLSADIEDKLMRLRMVPLSTVASRLHRTVRSTAQQIGKQVDLVLEGDATELDKGVLEEMADPLLHLLRNAVDHGIELPETRQARGKPAVGTIRLRAGHEGNQVVLRIMDDGAGLDPERVRATAVTRGLMSATEAAQAADDELFALVFQPGFSTAKEVSEISGRGVGLDVVKTHVHRLKGTITLDSAPGKGATFTIRLPMTLAIARALLVKARNQTFALPLENVRQILRVERDEIREVGNESVLKVGDIVYPVVFLDRALRLKGSADDAATRPPVLILNTGTRDIALVVDGLLGGREIVVKALGTHLRRVPTVTGATLMGDGSVVLILNPAELGAVKASARTARAAARPAAPTRKYNDLSILIVDDSPSVRRVVSSLVQGAGWTPVTAKDGLDALEQLHGTARPPDLVLLDVEMPRMDGFEFLSALRAEERFKGLPVVMVTSRAGDKHRRKAFDLGATGYMVKPYQDEAMVSLIRQLVTEARQVAAH